MVVVAVVVKGSFIETAVLPIQHFFSDLKLYRNQYVIINVGYKANIFRFIGSNYTVLWKRVDIGFDYFVFALGKQQSAPEA